jgi:histidyl-tRNA synthetase
LSQPNLAAVRGMNDVLPADIGAWQHLERNARELFAAYGFEELRVPLVEQTQLFKRAIGDFTDIVEKEMFTFTEADGESLTLRPEATAGIARAAITNGLLRGARLKLWTSGPMFRHERPQAGRYRQFNQFSVEALGFAGPDIDIEIIAMTARLWRQLGIKRVQLKLNSLRLPREARGLFHPACGRARRRQPAAPGRQSAAHPGQQEPRHAGRRQRCAAAVRIPGS